MNTNEYIELKQLLSELKNMIRILVPQIASISYLSDLTGRSRQSIRQLLINNFEPEVDYWNKGGRIFVSQRVAIIILTRSSKWIRG